MSFYPRARVKLCKNSKIAFYKVPSDVYDFPPVARASAESGFSKELQIQMKLSAAVLNFSLLFLLSSFQIAEAGVFDFAAPVQVYGDYSGETFSLAAPSPNNDNSIGASANESSFGATFLSNNPIDYVIPVVNSGGTTEIFNRSDLASFVNNTGVPWIGFQISVGYDHIGTCQGGQCGTDNFILSTLFDFLDLDSPHRDPAPTTDAFTTLAHGANQIDWTGGNAFSARFGFSFDLPDVNQDIPVDYLNGNQDGYFFTLRFNPIPGTAQTPGATTVPEPSTLILLSLAAAFAGAKKFRKSF